MHAGQVKLPFMLLVLHVWSPPDLQAMLLLNHSNNELFSYPPPRSLPLQQAIAALICAAMWPSKAKLNKNLDKNTW